MKIKRDNNGVLRIKKEMSGVIVEILAWIIVSCFCILVLLFILCCIFGGVHGFNFYRG